MINTNQIMYVFKGGVSYDIARGCIVLGIATNVIPKCSRSGRPGDVDDGC